MAQVSTGRPAVIRWWTRVDRNVEYEYELELDGQLAGSGGFAKEASIHTMADNLMDSGWDVTLEKGHYERVWVPDGV